MKKSLIIIGMILLLSCNKKDTIQMSKENNPIIENNINMDSKNVSDNETLISGITFNNSLFKKDEIDLKKYKYNGIYIENIKINDLLQKEYRENFFTYLENSVGKEDDYQSTVFTDLLMMRISQFEDKNAYFLLKESSKKTGISYMGIEFHNDYLWELVLDKFNFFIQEACRYNDIEILQYILPEMAPRYIKTESEIKDPVRMCDCVDLKKGMVLLNKDTLEVESNLKKFKDKFKSEKIIEIDCSPSLENEWKSTTNEYYDIKSFIEKNLETKLDNKEKIFFKVRIVPILKDYITK